MTRWNKPNKYVLNFSERSIIGPVADIDGIQD
jgi:hypothetical protein